MLALALHKTKQCNEVTPTTATEVTGLREFANFCSLLATDWKGEVEHSTPAKIYLQVVFFALVGDIFQNMVVAFFDVEEKQMTWYLFSCTENPWSTMRGCW